MNLVQIQERLKDVPAPSLMQYANGGNPMVPPYLALAELKRREVMTQSAQSQQAMQQGKQPSVKDQVEQAAGLASLQKQVQAQGLQSLMAQSRPQSVPENVPQPEHQPESEGVAGLPTGDMYNFKNGGIVAFAGGDLVGGEESLKSLKQLNDEYWQALRQDDLQSAKRIKQVIEERRAAVPRTVTVPVAPMDEAVTPQMQPAKTQVVAAEAPPIARSTPEQYATAQSQMVGDPQEVLRQIMSIPDPTERAAALDSLKRPVQPAAREPTAPMMPAPAKQGIASIPGSDEATQMMLSAMRKQTTPESAYETERKMAGLYGLTDQFGAERQSRIQQMQQEREKALQDRGVERLMRVLGGGAAGGLGGMGQAYLSAVEGERSSDAAFRQKMDELLSGVEEKRRAEATSGMTRAQTQMQKEREIGLGAAEKVADWQRRREDAMFELELKKQLSTMTPNEAMMAQNVIADIRQRNPNISYAEAYAMYKEAAQGATPEAKARAIQERLLETALKEWNDITIPDKVKNPKNLTQEQWLQEKLRTYGSAMPSGIGGTAGTQKAGSDVRSRADAILAGGR